MKAPANYDYTAKQRAERQRERTALTVTLRLDDADSMLLRALLRDGESYNDALRRLIRERS